MKTMHQNTEARDEQSRGVAQTRAMRKWLILLTVLLAGCWAVLGVLLFQNGRAGTAHANPQAAAAVAPSGPWGRLECTPLVLSPPLEYLAENSVDYSGEPAWHFPNVYSAGLSALFKEIGLSESLGARLLPLARPARSFGGLTIHPPRQLVLGLSPEDRRALYVALCEYPQNADQRNQFAFRADSADQWFAGSSVSPGTRKLVEPLIYRQGGFVYFADMRSINDSIPSGAERSGLFKALRREATFLVHLRVSGDSDVDALVNYWGRGGRALDVRPIIESLARSPAGGAINITHLLPPFARSRLYTYPARSTGEMKHRRDCHWTSLNFFSQVPDDRFCEHEEVMRTLRTDYYVIHGNLRLGDIAVVGNAKVGAIHSAVYIADDILFHRCGADSSAPWVLTRLENLKGFYPRKNMAIRYYRRKNL